MQVSTRIFLNILQNDLITFNGSSSTDRDNFDKQHPFVCDKTQTTDTVSTAGPNHGPNFNPYKLWTYDVPYKHLNLVPNKTLSNTQLETSQMKRQDFKAII